LSVDVVSDGARAPVSHDAARSAVRAVLRSERVTHALISVTFVSNRAIAALNRRHLHHRGPTDVISFGFTRATPDDAVVGDMYIAPHVARANARERKVPVRQELLRLVVHGTLHVLGYDHPEGTAEEREGSAMWKRQEQLVARLIHRGAPP
jgi:rRNA maturation RNase YbeY